MPRSLDALGNPFATRYIRPGALAFRFSQAAATGDRLVNLARRCAALRFCQIIGPHGSGKSTLLASLEPLIAREGYELASFALHDGERALPVSWSRRTAWNQQTFVIVDGYEQLAWWRRWHLKRYCRRRCAGLLVTAHRDTGLPTLWQTRTSVELLRSLAHDLTMATPDQQVTEAQIQAAYERHGDNLREALFQLYDDVSRTTSGTT